MSVGAARLARPASALFRLSVARRWSFGLCVGSFLNVVIHRLPKMMEREWRAQCAELAGQTARPRSRRYNLVVPRSALPALRPPDHARWKTFRVVSWLVLRGKCVGCRRAISARYPLVELLAGIAAGYVAWRFGPTLGSARRGALRLVHRSRSPSSTSDTQLLPDDLTLPLLWVGLLVNLGGAFVPLRDAVIGAVAGYLSLWLVYWGFKLAHRQGRHGLRRLQDARRGRRLARLEDAAARDPAVVGGGRWSSASR